MVSKPLLVLKILFKLSFQCYNFSSLSIHQKIIFKPSLRICILGKFIFTVLTEKKMWQLVIYIPEWTLRVKSISNSTACFIYKNPHVEAQKFNIITCKVMAKIIRSSRSSLDIENFPPIPPPTIHTNTQLHNMYICLCFSRDSD